MSGDDGFLTRWSRRRRSAVARQRASTKPQPPPVVTNVTAPKAAAAPVSRGASDAIAELPSLPPIESLDAASDITPFLMPGVPAELMRQALRRAWTADPAIRDFVGLAENAWDFTAPNGVPGFGPLSAEEADRLLARVLGPADNADTAPPPRTEPAAPTADAAPSSEGAEAEGRDGSPDHLEGSRELADDASMQQEIGEAETGRLQRPRSHGGALPK